ARVSPRFHTRECYGFRDGRRRTSAPAIPSGDKENRARVRRATSAARVDCWAVNPADRASRPPARDDATLRFQSAEYERALVRRRRNANVRDRRRLPLAQPSKQVAVTELVCGGCLFAACAMCDLSC